MRHLNELDRRLEDAAEEVRAVARYASSPYPSGRATGRARAWVVFATTFAAVALAIGALPLLFRSGDPDLAWGPSTSLVDWVTTTMLAPTTTTPVGACSAAGLPVPSDQEGLPEAVADIRRAIGEAAVACDFAALQELAGPDLETSFGGGGFENLVELEESGDDEPMRLLVQLLDVPHAAEDYPDLPTHYYWPSAFVYDSWDEIPVADLAALREVYTEEELDEIAAFGAYAGWRVGITEDGDWRFFVAGD